METQKVIVNTTAQTPTSPVNTQDGVKPATQQKKDKPKPRIHDANSKQLPISLIIWVGILLLNLVGIGIFINLIPQKAKQVQKLRSQVLSETISSQDATILTKALEETKAQRAQLVAAFPNEESLVNFIQLVDQLKEQGVTIVRFSVDSDLPTKIGRNPSFLPITLYLQGSLAHVAEALQSVSDSPYLIRPIAFNIKFDNSGGQVMVQTQFHLYVSDAYSKSQAHN